MPLAVSWLQPWAAIPFWSILPKLNGIQLSAICCCRQSGGVMDLFATCCLLLGQLIPSNNMTLVQLYKYHHQSDKRQANLKAPYVPQTNKQANKQNKIKTKLVIWKQNYDWKFEIWKKKVPLHFSQWRPQHSILYLCIFLNECHSFPFQIILPIGNSCLQSLTCWVHW